MDGGGEALDGGVSDAVGVGEVSDSLFFLFGFGKEVGVGDSAGLGVGDASAAFPLPFELGDADGVGVGLLFFCFAAVEVVLRFFRDGVGVGAAKTFLNVSGSVCARASGAINITASASAMKRCITGRVPAAPPYSVECNYRSSPAGNFRSVNAPGNQATRNR